MSVSVQRASIAAWNDEEHVRANRRLYAEKYAAVLPLAKKHLKTDMPDGGFYLWIETPVDDGEFARGLHRDCNILVLPGSFLAREAHGRNPGRNHIRVALVAPLAECAEAFGRINDYTAKL